MENVTHAKAAIAAAVAVLTALWGWFGWLVVLFVGCMAVDYLTGSVAAMRRGFMVERERKGRHLAQVWVYHRGDGSRCG